MSFLLVAVELAAQVAQSVFIKLFGRKCKKGDITFTALMVLTALVFFAFMSIGKPFSLGVLPYALLFAITYACGTLMYILAITCGSMGLTALIISYSLIIPTLYGIIFWNESLTTVQIIGIAALCISLFLVREQPEPQKKAASLKWLIFMILAFIGNGACSVVQRQQQIVFGEKFDMCFMVISLAVASVIMIAAVALLDRKNFKAAVKGGLLPAIGCGVSNGVANLFVMLTLGLGLMSASIFFPIIAAGQTILTFAVSMIFFGERFIARQWVGIAVGTVSLVLMNI